MAPLSANRFDLIRLLLAAAVFIYHGVVLSNLVPEGELELILSGFAETAIQGFFIVSGLLVTGSLERSGSLTDYAGKRVRRLYPAYATVILIPAVICLLLGGGWQGVGAYLAANLVFLNFLSPDLPGFFEGNRFTEVNGALWTLKIEVMFYMALPLIFWVLKAFRSFWWIGIGLLYAGGMIWAFAVPHLMPGHMGEQIARQLPGQMAYFAIGIAMWKMMPHLRRRWRGLALAGTVLLGATYLNPWLEPLKALALAGVIAAAAWAPGPQLNAARFGDVSYGLYITHFPILQVMVAAGLATALGLPLFMLVATVLILAASYALWHFVEKPALRPSSHYRRAASANET